MRRHFKVVPKRPFSLAETCRRIERFEERVDRFDDGVFRRLVFVHNEPLLVTVAQSGPASRAVLDVTLEGAGARRIAASAAAERILDRVLGTSFEVQPFYRRFRDDAIVGPLIRRHRGLRVVGRLTLWHTLVQIVLSQQINLKLAHDMLSELVSAFGAHAEVRGERYYDFPTPERFASLDIDRLREFRLSRAKASTLIGLARAMTSGELSESGLRALDDDEAVSALMEFKGVGRWTAEFTVLRGLSRMDVFPAGDLGVVKHVAARWLGRDGPASEDEMRQFSERWRPYRGLALIYAYAELG